MARQGFARCTLGPAWHFLPTDAVCKKQAPLPPAQESARVRWAAGLSKKPNMNGA